ncbi:uncharacterized protein LOC110984322 [Acanthaster planci]|uniref:Uncharacterized protein LOC110984322 n=1 Tax=Acanthaster planci TaxID=133434 RepID=A0A8B7Z5J4_ACAPL|nr:uncharacterized protein LOC110984322 [Acanthaster planci]
MASAQESQRTRRRHCSEVGDLIKFRPEENPKWRKEEDNVPPLDDMVREIVGFQAKWNLMKEKCNADVGSVQRQFLDKFIFHCNKEEDHGCDTLEDTQECLASKKDYSDLSDKEKETVDLKNAYEYLLDVKEKEKDTKSHGMIEESMLRGAHKIILKSAPKNPHLTELGQYSDKQRYTTYKGEIHEYQMPDDMHRVVNNILDRFNSLFEESQSRLAKSNSQGSQTDEADAISQGSQTDEAEDSQQLFDNTFKLLKTCSWLVFEMLDLHPFGDGNGRLCRLLCSYVLSTCTPFPTPIYNIWSTSSKDDYKDALVEARKTEGRHPRALATMIIECSWYGWKEFLKHFPEVDTDEKPGNDASCPDIPEQERHSLEVEDSSLASVMSM